MKKLIVLAFISFVTSTPQLHSISLAEYIAQQGTPQVNYGRLRLSGIGLTDLTGLQNIPNINQVTNLNLSNNQLQTLPDTIFNSLPNLRSLYLDNNQLQTLPDTIFNNLNNLQELRLNNNQLQPTLPATLFNGLDTLMFLSLGNNQLRTLPATIFNSLMILLELQLNNNQLQTLPETIFNRLGSLQVLDLRGNPFDQKFIPTLMDMIRRITHLEKLNGMQKDQALRYFPFPTLKQLTADNIAKNLDKYRPTLHELPADILDLLPLTPEERAEIDARRAGQ